MLKRRSVQKSDLNGWTWLYRTGQAEFYDVPEDIRLAMAPVPLAHVLDQSSYALDDDGLSINRDLTPGEWEILGRLLMRRTSAVQWSLGDWLVYGGRANRGQWSRALGSRSGSVYDKAMQVTGIKKTTLCAYYVTALAFPRGVRDVVLPWTHYREIARMPRKQQRFTLEEAAKKRWTVTQVRAEVAATTGSSRSHSNGERRDNGYKPLLVECPRCRHQFEPKLHKVKGTGIFIHKTVAVPVPVPETLKEERSCESSSS